MFCLWQGRNSKGTARCCAWGDQHGWFVITLATRENLYYVRSAAAPSIYGCVLPPGCQPRLDPLLGNTVSPSSPLSLPALEAYSSLFMHLSIDRKKIHTWSITKPSKRHHHPKRGGDYQSTAPHRPTPCPSYGSWGLLATIWGGFLSKGDSSSFRLRSGLPAPRLQKATANTKKEKQTRNPPPLPNPPHSQSEERGAVRSGISGDEVHREASRLLPFSASLFFLLSVVTLELALFICSRIHAFKDTVLLCRPSRDSLSSLR